ncbi:MAG: RNA pseudouridine synthase [Bacteroidetes bacterium]|nr:RNA pseudouridine synthase [Bacteroidota bacterium]
MTVDDLRILYEDNHIIAVNKPAGMLVQGDKTGDETLGDIVKQYIKAKYDKPGEVFLGIVHRIDRPVSGLVLFARTTKALQRLNEMFQKREIQKTYWAIVQSPPAQQQGVLVDWLRKNEEKNASYVYPEGTKGALRCELEYKLLASSDNYYLLEVDPHTGRHHQIRVQLSHMGCIIKGDLKYGAKRSNRDASICLHARAIEFIHPVKKESVRITAPVPEDNLWKAFEQMVGDTTPAA